MTAVTDAADPLSARARHSWIGPLRAWLLEGVIAFGTAGAFVATCLLIRVNPMNRIGQVSGLASLGLRFFLFGMVLVGVLAYAARAREGRGFETASRLVCAAIAGLATGMIAGGVLVALYGTPWGLNAMGGDAGALARWAGALQRGEPVPPMYPPLALHVHARYADLVGLTPELALKHLQLIGTAMFGPVAYLSWRLLLRPPWALAVGVIAMLPLVEPYKPFPGLVLVVFVPLAIRYLDSIRTSAERPRRELALAAVAHGAGFGFLFLSYSGWFQWAAPGLVAAALIVFPWRTAPRKALALLALTGVVFLLVTGQYLAGLLFDPAAKIADNYVYFDVNTEPMYIAIFRNDTPGPVGMWPPIGELGGVGLFTIVLLVGLGIAITLGANTTLVIGLGSITLGAWLMRFYLARQMWDTKLVQLYPRTTAMILYCMLILTGLAVYWLLQRVPSGSPIRRPAGRIGAVCALLLMFGSAGSATSDRYMPSNTTPPGAGMLAWNAQRTWRGRLTHLKSQPRSWIRRSQAEAPAP